MKILRAVFVALLLAFAIESSCLADGLSIQAVAESVPVPVFVIKYKEVSYNVIGLVRTIRVPANTKTPIGVRQYAVLAQFKSDQPVIIPNEEYRKLTVSKEIPDYREYSNKHPYLKQFQDTNNRWGAFVGQMLGLAITAVSAIGG